MLLLVAATPFPRSSIAAEGGWEAPAEAKKVKNPVESTKESVARGEALYKTSCLDCHGAQGHGDGKQAKGLTKKPADLAKELHEYSDGDIFWKISEGKRPMPSFKKDLKEAQRWDIVNYLRKAIQAPAKTAPADTTQGKPEKKDGADAPK
jgi:mono/diheme cytochrome c family protein